MKCKICGKEIENRLGSHIQVHNITIQQYYDLYISTNTEKYCPICGKPNTFYGLTKGYSEHCSKQCSRKDIHVKEKVEQTCLQRYGATNVYASEYGKAKIKETNLRRYGVENPQQDKKIREKTEQTNIKKYGCADCRRSKQAKQTNLLRYGSENPAAFGSTLYKQGMINKYGVDNPQKVTSIKHKTEQTCLRKYGVRNPAQNLEIRQKTERRHYRYNGINFDSSWELAVWIYFTDHNINIEREPIKLPYYDNNKLHYYFPDFRIYGQLVEIKASWRLQRLIGTKKYDCMIANKVIIWEDEQIQPFLQYCENKYNDKSWFKQFLLKKEVMSDGK